MGFNMTVCRVCFEAAVILMEHCSVCVGWHDRPPACRLLAKLAHLKTPASPSKLIAGGSLSSQKTYFVFSGIKTNSKILQFCKALSPAREKKQHLWVLSKLLLPNQSAVIGCLPRAILLVEDKCGAKLLLNHLQQFQMKLFTVAGCVPFSGSRNMNVLFSWGTGLNGRVESCVAQSYVTALMLLCYYSLPCSHVGCPPQNHQSLPPPLSFFSFYLFFYSQ